MKRWKVNLIKMKKKGCLYNINREKYLHAMIGKKK